jgi:MerR family mercuric resistance operon transcriptional regulator
MATESKSYYSIGELASAADCKVETVRYYEKTALMPTPSRTEGGHRFYVFDHLKRLVFIRRSRELGFSIEQINKLLKLVDEPNHTCGEVKALTMLQSREVQKKINDLKRLQKALNSITASCKGKNYSIENCPIVNALYK